MRGMGRSSRGWSSQATQVSHLGVAASPEFHHPTPLALGSLRAGSVGLLALSAMDRRGQIEARLRAELDARHVDVADESHRHAGHAGAAAGGGHFRATIVSHRFEGLSRIARQRLVYGVLAAEMKSEIHALALRTLTPAEWASERD
jgi:BolA family transcriptional regulator, general stress-responsive regulator